MASVKVIEFDEDEEVESVTVKLSAREALFVTLMAGRYSGDTAEKLMAGGAEVVGNLYSTLTGTVWSPHYGGVDVATVQHSRAVSR